MGLLDGVARDPEIEFMILQRFYLVYNKLPGVVLPGFIGVALVTLAVVLGRT